MTHLGLILLLLVFLVYLSERYQDRAGMFWFGGCAMAYQDEQNVSLGQQPQATEEKKC